MNDTLNFMVGDEIEIEWRGTTITVNERMHRAVTLARAACIMAATMGQTITYKQLSLAIGGLYPYRRLGTMLDLLSYDCFERGEDYSLALMVVKASSGTCGDGMVVPTGFTEDGMRTDLVKFWQEAAK